MKPALFKVFGIGALLILTCCQPKEDLSEVFKELTTFQSEWLESGSAIRQTLDSLKNDNQALTDLILKMKKVKDSNKKLPSRSKASFDSLYISVNQLKDSLSLELKNFNNLTQNWNHQKANLSQLRTSVESKSITQVEANEKLNNLRAIRASAIKELKELQQVRDIYSANFKTYQSKFETGFQKI